MYCGTALRQRRYSVLALIMLVSEPQPRLHTALALDWQYRLRWLVDPALSRKNKRRPTETSLVESCLCRFVAGRRSSIDLWLNLIE